jgi:hypothetical protein
MKVLYSLVHYIFLRLYARNLGRSYRNQPQQALDGAVVQTNTMLAVLFGTVLVVLVAWIYPSSLQGGSESAFSVVLIALVPLLLFFSRDLRRFGSDPRALEQAARFGSNSDRRITTLGFFLLPACCTGLAVLAFHLIAR